MRNKIIAMENNTLTINGQLNKKALWPPIKIFFTVTGIALFTGALTLMARFLFRLRANATAALADGTLIISATYSVFGRDFKTVRTVTPEARIHSIQLEKRYSVIHLVVGFGFLAIGLFCGVHWLLGGLGAGYPFLFLAGAGVIAAGIAIDVILCFMIPQGEGRSSVIVNTAGWRFRLTGLAEDDVHAVHKKSRR